jgi:Zn-dependent metalloprotease
MDFVGGYLRASLLVLIATSCGCAPERAPSSLADLAEHIESSGSITFRRDIDIDPRTLFELYGTFFDLPANTTMRLVEDSIAPNGDAQLRFQQFHRGIEIEGADFRVLARKNRALSGSSHLAHEFSPGESTPRLSEERAWNIVQERMNTEHDSPDLATITRPQGALVFAELTSPSDKSPSTANHRVLAWRFDAYVQPIARSRRVYVDALEGRIVKEARLRA